MAKKEKLKYNSKFYIFRVKFFIYYLIGNKKTN